MSVEGAVSVKGKRFRSCFISAPFGADTSALRRLLDRKNIRWRDQTDVRAGRSSVEAVEMAMERSDFVCVVIPTESHRANTMFELGIAYARKKPVLAFLSQPLSLPSGIQGLTYSLADLANQEALGAALDAFLTHATRTSHVKPIAIPPVPKRKSTAGPRPASATPRSFEQSTADLFRESGFIVSDSSKKQQQGADFAVWIDQVQHSLGNPVLVEIKAGVLSSDRLDEAEMQLRKYVTKTHAGCGLLVYWDEERREFPSFPVGWPLVFRLSGKTLTRLASQGLLAKELVRLRNDAVHGKA